jgi:hypothetical protein
MIVRGYARDYRPVIYITLGNDRLKDHTLNCRCLLYTVERAIQSMSRNHYQFPQSIPLVQEYVVVADCLGKLFLFYSYFILSLFLFYS